MCLKTGVFYGKVDLHDLLIRENKQSRKKEMSLGEAQKAVSIQMKVRGRSIKGSLFACKSYWKDNWSRIFNRLD